jgi:chemotaxis protein methyltransferase CheR
LSDLDHFRQLLQTRTGLIVGPDKGYLVQSRLDAVALARGMKDATAVLASVRAGLDQPLVEAAIDAMNTHESLFFRDGLPFEQLNRTVLAQVLAGKPADAPLRIWSAACSSGQEPYSIAMALMEQQHRLGGRRVEILATDVSTPILAKARAGIYSDFEVNRGLAPERRDRWMRKVGLQWEMVPQLKAMVMFRQHNIMDAPPAHATFDIVFCRNVLIYFDVAGKAKALGVVARAMAPGGFLFLGGAETTGGISSAFQMLPGERGLVRLGGAEAVRKVG